MSTLAARSSPARRMVATSGAHDTATARALAQAGSPAGVVSVGVRDEQAAQAVGGDTEARQTVEEQPLVHAGAGIDERQLGAAVDEVDVTVGRMRQPESVAAAAHEMDPVGDAASLASLEFDDGAVSGRAAHHRLGHPDARHGVLAADHVGGALLAQAGDRSGRSRCRRRRRRRPAPRASRAVPAGACGTSAADWTDRPRRRPRCRRPRGGRRWRCCPRPGAGGCRDVGDDAVLEFELRPDEVRLRPTRATRFEGSHTAHA